MYTFTIPFQLATHFISQGLPTGFIFHYSPSNLLYTSLHIPRCCTLHYSLQGAVHFITHLPTCCTLHYTFQGAVQTLLVYYSQTNCTLHYSFSKLVYISLLTFQLAVHFHSPSTRSQIYKINKCTYEISTESRMDVLFTFITAICQQVWWLYTTLACKVHTFAFN